MQPEQTDAREAGTAAIPGTWDKVGLQTGRPVAAPPLSLELREGKGNQVQTERGKSSWERWGEWSSCPPSSSGAGEGAVGGGPGGGRQDMGWEIPRVCLSVSLDNDLSLFPAYSLRGAQQPPLHRRTDRSCQGGEHVPWQCPPHRPQTRTDPPMGLRESPQGWAQNWLYGAARLPSG